MEQPSVYYESRRLPYEVATGFSVLVFLLAWQDVFPLAAATILAILFFAMARIYPSAVLWIYPDQLEYRRGSKSLTFAWQGLQLLWDQSNGALKVDYFLVQGDKVSRYIDARRIVKEGEPSRKGAGAELIKIIEEKSGNRVALGGLIGGNKYIVGQR